METNSSRTLLTVSGLVLATVLLTGCPKRPMLAPAAGAGSGKATTPAPATSGREYVRTAALRDVHFEVDRSTIRPEDEPLLDANARWLESNRMAHLLIAGPADERGAPAHNVALAERRAKATRDALVARGIEASRITVKGYGEQRPLCTESTGPCWAMNRRAQFLVKL